MLPVIQTGTVDQYTVHDMGTHDDQITGSDRKDIALSREG